MFNPIARGEFGIVSIVHPDERRSSSSALVIHQFAQHSKKNDKQQQELVISCEKEVLSERELKKKSDYQPLLLEMCIDVKRNVRHKRGTVEECAEIRFYRIPFMLSWVDALIALYAQLPTQSRTVEAAISYQDILDRKKEDRKKEESNSTVMGESAIDAYQRFLQELPIKLPENHLELIAPQWCHIVMSAGLPSHIAQQKSNMCCGPEGLNIAMKVPEHMVARLAEHLHDRQEKVHVQVKLQLFSGTSVVQSMQYNVVTDTVKICATYDHPFRMPHFHYENQGVAHLETIMGEKLKEASSSDYRFGA